MLATTYGCGRRITESDGHDDSEQNPFQKEYHLLENYNFLCQFYNQHEPAFTPLHSLPPSVHSQLRPLIPESLIA